MKALIQSISNIYGMLLRLFPRDFQHEFREEMEDVFAASLEEASKTGATLVVRACFFELLDLPVNLAVEYLSQLRKGNDMQTLTSGIRRTMAVLLAALSMMIGWVVIYLTYQYLRESGQMDHLSGDILLLFAYAFPIILCGLMLGIIAGIDRRAFLRIGLWTAVGGMFGYLADIPVRMINTWRILNHVSTSSVWYIWVVYLCMITVMATYGLFCGGGLGFAFGGWKACKRFALFGMLANAIGIVVASLISTGAYNLLFHGSSVWTQITGSRIYSSILPYLNSAFTGILSGSVLGWFFGNEGKRGFADPRENLVANT